MGDACNSTVVVFVTIGDVTRAVVSFRIADVKMDEDVPVVVIQSDDSRMAMVALLERDVVIIADCGGDDEDKVVPSAVVVTSRSDDDGDDDVEGNRNCVEELPTCVPSVLPSDDDWA